MSPGLRVLASRPECRVLFEIITSFWRVSVSRTACVGRGPNFITNSGRSNCAETVLLTFPRTQQCDSGYWDAWNTGHNTSAFVDQPPTSYQRPIVNGDRYGRKQYGGNRREKYCFLHNPSIVKIKPQTKKVIGDITIPGKMPNGICLLADRSKIISLDITYFEDAQILMPERIF
ncbi:hypothetical protein J6590_003867 [Homalodisca vitripennis]|nr:hypothetical protein J6590_003867 [Homalodisca vitripennis]